MPIGGDEFAPLKRQTTPSLIADRIRRKILSGAFGPGTRIVEPQLAEQLGVSRGPIREALQRLVQEGILTNLPNKGVCVVTLGIGDFRDIFSARRMVEKEAARYVFASKDSRTINAMRATVDRMSVSASRSDRSGVIDCDLEFHTVLVRGMGSARIDRMFSTLTAETYLCLKNLVPFYDNLNDLVIEHQEILRLIIEDDLPALLNLIDDHFDSGLKTVDQ
ncbi:GntR family transcriptional regulator [Rhizobium sp. NZLR11]|uniref:GntR family transcriptional regulator n=1 Tax=Rhizobium sp. NZLR11 TaxID=2731098 RepID=UPI001C835E48|nr:GntR family transcriptional regulator [Rhizobium sp. NZLR11]MBX5210533.1 GntR family transcriptional regulator [Rhizobium sp. NZLR11]